MDTTLKLFAAAKHLNVHGTEPMAFDFDPSIPLVDRTLHLGCRRRADLPDSLHSGFEEHTILNRHIL